MKEVTILNSCKGKLNQEKRLAKVYYFTFILILVNIYKTIFLHCIILFLLLVNI